MNTSHLYTKLFGVLGVTLLLMSYATHVSAEAAPTGSLEGFTTSDFNPQVSNGGGSLEGFTTSDFNPQFTNGGGSLEGFTTSDFNPQFTDGGTGAAGGADASTAAGAMCGMTSWAFAVTNCKPAGPGPCTGSTSAGRDNCSCSSVGTYMGKTFTVTGVCKAGCCQAVSYPTIGSSLMSGLTKSVMGQILGQVTGSVLQKILGSGSDSGSSGNYSGSSYTYPTSDYGGSSDDGLLSYDDYSGSTDASSGGFSLTDWIFGGGSSAKDDTQTGSTPAAETTASGQTTTESGDVVTTTYGSGSTAGTAGTNAGYDYYASDVEAELANTTLDTNITPPAGTVLTRAELERQALEEQARLAQLGGGKGSLSVAYERVSQNDLNTITDYGTSNVSRSQRTSEQYGAADASEQSDEKPLWERAIEFVKMLFGAN